MAIPGFDDYDVEQTLDAVEAAYRAAMEDNATMFVGAAHFAHLHEELPARPGGGRVPGGERLVRIGGPGTPKVSEFACAELGARMQMSPAAARYYLADALDVQHRLPLIWARVVAGEVKVSWARKVAQKTHHLSVEAAAVVDAGVVEAADGRIPSCRFETLLEAKVKQADPEAAARREQEAAARRYARASRISEDGMRAFVIRGPLGLIARFDATIDYLARALAALGDTDTLEDRRLKAVLILTNPAQAVHLLAAFAAWRKRNPSEAAAPEDPPEPPAEPVPDPDTEPEPVENPASSGVSTRSTTDEPTDEPTDGVESLLGGWFDPDPPPDLLRRLGLPVHPPGFCYDPKTLLPQVNLYVHAHRDTIEAGEGGVSRVEGHGPMTLQWLSEHLGPLHFIKATKVIDLNNQAPVDAYEIPDSLREAVRIMTPADGFTFATQVGKGPDADDPEPDADHNKAHKKGGPTTLGNFARLIRLHHRIKTHGGWQLKQPYPGIFLWRDPHGRYYLVDHTGTRALRPVS
ncbi:MAG: DUF222 domain-containing protein [Nocardioidaceae bacterium]